MCTCKIVEMADGMCPCMCMCVCEGFVRVEKRNRLQVFVCVCMYVCVYMFVVGMRMCGKTDQAEVRAMTDKVYSCIFDHICK